MKNYIKRNETKGFTLVELLAVIVILAIILVIAVPKVMSVIEDAKKATLESTAKMIASQAEKQKVQNTVLGNTNAITCKDITNINDVDYASCDIDFENDTAKVTIEGSGKFDGLYVCGGTKTSAVAIDEECPLEYGNASTYISKLLAKESELNNGLIQTTVTHNGNDYNAGIRYAGKTDNVKNKVYYNCDDVDSAGIAYGKENYDYESSCEVWRIIGVFDTKTSEGGTSKKRLKLINVESTFKASWDGSVGGYNVPNSMNYGWGINQWGESTYEDGTPYEGADLMQFLNGYYVGKNNSNCIYYYEFNNEKGQGAESKTCTLEQLKEAKMKVLTNTAKGLIENAVWDTYGVQYETLSSGASSLYLQEKGISHQYIGKICEETTTVEMLCDDTVIRTTSWTGLVGLMSVADIEYAVGWIWTDIEGTFSWSITPVADKDMAFMVWYNRSKHKDDSASTFISYYSNIVMPTVYLKSDIKIIGGNGGTEPYILAM